MNNTHFIEAVYERDIDLLLLEEIITNSDFIDWFIAKCKLPVIGQLVGAWHSISESGLGESDLVVEYKSKEETVILLIENKIDASFTLRQYERYRKRLNNYLNKGQYTLGEVILTAPKEYIQSQNQFGISITYQDLREFFLTANDKRSLYKAELLTAAITKQRRGYTPQNSSQNLEFWRNYWKYQKEHYSEFFMKEPKLVPHGSTWATMKYKPLKSLTFYHKWSSGFIDVDIRFKSEKKNEKILSSLPAGVEVIQLSRSYYLRMLSSIVDNRMPFASQLPFIKEGLDKISFLKGFLLDALTS